MRAIVVISFIVVDGADRPMKQTGAAILRFTDTDYKEERNVHQTGQKPERSPQMLRYRELGL
jgi:hypothetical protein